GYVAVKGVLIRAQPDLRACFIQHEAGSFRFTGQSATASIDRLALAFLVRGGKAAVYSPLKKSSLARDRPGGRRKTTLPRISKIALKNLDKYIAIV
ncbi:MAG: hypothetical protein PVF18_08940, partial [Anaerolineales bacterium]